MGGCALPQTPSEGRGKNSQICFSADINVLADNQVLGKPSA